jgi:hypothetical protein
MHIILAAIAAYVFGVFTPSFGRIVKSFFAKEATKAVAVVEADVKAEVKKL